MDIFTLNVTHNGDRFPIKTTNTSFIGDVKQQLSDCYNIRPVQAIRLVVRGREVFDDFMDHRQTYSDTSILSTELFFYGPIPDKEYSLPIDKGKNLIVRYLAKGEPNANGSSSVFFELNGQPRTIEITNTEFSKNVATKIKSEESNPNHIGSPLPGQVAKIFVNEGIKVIKGDRVLVIEAMKMETTINAEKSGTIKKIYVNSRDNVETKDLLVEIE